MNIENIIAKTNLKSEKVAAKKYNLLLNASYPDKTKMEISIIEENGKIYISDNKLTLKFMNKLYELKSDDVKLCINNVLKHYKFSVAKGEVLAEIKSENDIMSTFIEFIMCIGQLTNMYVFFDEP